MKKSFSALIVLLVLLAFPSNASAGSLFEDVYDTHPVVPALEYLVDEGIVQGYEDGKYFSPLGLINRAEFTKMLVVGLLEEAPDGVLYAKCFEDVQEEWFAPYVCYAEEKGWVSGYEDQTFHPGDFITRAEAIKIVAKSLEWTLRSKGSYFWDIDLTDQDQWYSPYIVMAEERDILDRFDSFVSPHELLSRAQMAELLYRSLRYDEGKSFEVWILESQMQRAYTEILETGIEPAYPADMLVAHTPQSGYPYGCYTFATKNLLEWKYGWLMNVPEVQAAIGWDGEYIWTDEEFAKFATIYAMDVVFTYNASAEFFFKKLAMGEPMILYIPYYLDTDGDGLQENVGHNLVAYSFDQEGVWVADSIYPGSQRHIGYDQVFVDNDFTTLNLTQIRQVKDGGLRKDQWGL